MRGWLCLEGAPTAMLGWWHRVVAMRHGDLDGPCRLPDRGTRGGGRGRLAHELGPGRAFVVISVCCRGVTLLFARKTASQSVNQSTSQLANPSASPLTSQPVHQPVSSLGRAATRRGSDRTGTGPRGRAPGRRACVLCLRGVGPMVQSGAGGSFVLRQGRVRAAAGQDGPGGVT